MSIMRLSEGYFTLHMLVLGKYTDYVKHDKGVTEIVSNQCLESNCLLSHLP